MRTCRQIFGMMMGLFVVTGCSYEPFPTQWMPNGYRYQDETPLSSPAPSRPWVKEAARPNLNKLADNTAAWQGAVYELINPLPGSGLSKVQPLTLRTRAPTYPADGAFDHFLRQGLISYGYQLADAGQAGPTVTYDSAPLSNPAIEKLAREKLGAEVIPAGDKNSIYYLTLDVVSARNRLLGSYATIAILPHEKAEYRRYPGFSNQPPQGWDVNVRPVYETRQ